MRVFLLACFVAATLFTPAAAPQAGQAGPAGAAHPTVLSTANPVYTDEARDKKINGTVRVGLVVDTDGNPTNVHVISGVGYGLDEKAVEAVRQYKFKPAMKQGAPVPSTISIDVRFQIF